MSERLSALERTRLRLPIRVKLALVSAGLTLVILCLFAVVVGAFTERKLRAGFDDDLRATAADLQERIRLRAGPDGEPRPVAPPDLVRAAAAGGAVIRVIDPDGRVIAATRVARNLGPPVEGVRDVAGYRVVSRPLLGVRSQGPGPFGLIAPPVAGTAGFVQYGKPETSLNATIDRVRLFLALGVLGGTALAFLAGFLVARRAMRPIAGLTQAAREVARTRDPAVSLPKPQANDEVADLAATLEEMLAELSAARAETEAALARQREFVADASHELRTPLTSILANLELLEAELAGEQADMAGSALRSSRRMRRLVADLLLLARADAGRRAPRGEVDLAAAVREAAAEAAPLADEHELRLDLEPAPVEGAPDDLHRLVLNLIENALVHTPAGTTVRASVRRADGVAVLEVEDDGPGVPKALHDRVFERFTHGDGASRAVGGSGLGLAIVQAVAEAHGGGVELRAGDAGGARFTVTLPLATGAGPLRSDAAGVSAR